MQALVFILSAFVFGQSPQQIMQQIQQNNAAGVNMVQSHLSAGSQILQSHGVNIPRPMGMGVYVLPSQVAWTPRKKATPLASDAEVIGQLRPISPLIPNMDDIPAPTYDEVANQLVPGREYRVIFPRSPKKGARLFLSESLFNAFQQQMNYLKYYRWMLAKQLEKGGYESERRFARVLDSFVTQLKCLDTKKETNRFEIGAVKTETCTIEEEKLLEHLYMMVRYLKLRRQAYGDAEKAKLEPGDKMLADALHNIARLYNLRYNEAAVDVMSSKIDVKPREQKRSMIVSTSASKHVPSKPPTWKENIWFAAVRLDQITPKTEALVVPIPVPAPQQPAAPEKKGEQTIVIQIQQNSGQQTNLKMETVAPTPAAPTPTPAPAPPAAPAAEPAAPAPQPAPMMTSKPRLHAGSYLNGSLN